MFIGLLAGIINASKNTTCISLNNQQCMTQTTLINLHPNKNSKWLRYYSFAINLDRCVGSCNILNSLYNKVFFLEKTEDLKLNGFKMITEINESRSYIAQVWM